jgi:hypothetical protein
MVFCLGQSQRSLETAGAGRRIIAGEADTRCNLQQRNRISCSYSVQGLVDDDLMPSDHLGVSDLSIIP